MKARIWFERIQNAFQGERYKAWLSASYPNKNLQLSSLQTGDVVMLRLWEPFRNTNPTGEEWGQVGMVVNEPSARLREAYELPADEASFLLMGDFDAHNHTKVRLVSLRAYLRSCRELYGNDILEVCRKLELPNRKSDSETFPGLENWLLSLRGWYYARPIEQMLARIQQQAQELRSRTVFSSQLVTAAYEAMGLVSKEDLPRYMQGEWLRRQLKHGWEMTRMRLQRGASLSLGWKIGQK